ncbi:MAG TPA: sigma-70 family RNA polymerase sigma factor [Dehalococcoidia bacterium]
MTGDAHAAPTSPPASGDAAVDDSAALAALRAGDERTFSALVARHSAALQRLALVYVHDAATAEEVVQEAWIGLLQSLDRFEGRSTLKTWLFRILVNCARARARKESRTVPFSAAFPAEGEASDGIEARRFYPGWLPSIGGHWRRPPAHWGDEPEQRALAAETLAVIRTSIDSLAPGQREVIILRDVEGCSSAEVCNVLGLTDTNQRVLLHRARSNVRRALESRLGEAKA